MTSLFSCFLVFSMNHLLHFPPNCNIPWHLSPCLSCDMGESLSGRQLSPRHAFRGASDGGAKHSSWGWLNVAQAYRNGEVSEMPKYSFSLTSSHFTTITDQWSCPDVSIAQAFSKPCELGTRTFDFHRAQWERSRSLCVTWSVLCSLGVMVTVVVI